MSLITKIQQIAARIPLIRYYKFKVSESRMKEELAKAKQSGLQWMLENGYPILKYADKPKKKKLIKEERKRMENAYEKHMNYGDNYPHIIYDKKRK